jgi:hypothetical protein
MKGCVYSYWLYASELRWYVTTTLQLEMMCYRSEMKWTLYWKRYFFHYVNKGNNKITELRTILQRESQNS